MTVFLAHAMTSLNSEDPQSVSGLHLIKDFISKEEETQLLEGFCAPASSLWLEGLNRRVQVTIKNRIYPITNVLIYDASIMALRSPMRRWI